MTTGIALAILFHFACVPGTTWARASMRDWAPHSPAAQKSAANALDAAGLAAEPAPRPLAVVPDDTGGWISAWIDVRNSGSSGAFYVYELFVQRYTGGGDVAPGWPAYGLPVLDMANDADVPQVVADGAGGVIIVWMDYTSSWPMPRAQRITADGVRFWSPGGVVLSVFNSYRWLDSIVGDGQGGVYAAWTDYGPTIAGAAVVVQRVTPAGAVATGWPGGGISMSTMGGYHDRAKLFPHGNGVLVLWQHDDPVGEWASRFQRLDPLGVKQLGADGVALSGIPPVGYAAATDKANGFIAAWASSPLPWAQITAQRYNESGAKVWLSAGIVVGPANEHQENPKIAADGNGGVWVAWRNLQETPRVFAQRLSATGLRGAGWPIEGWPVHNQQAATPTILPDAAGGAWFAWDQPGTKRRQLWVRRLEGNGYTEWPDAGVKYSGTTETAITDDLGFAFAADGSLIAEWQDLRGGTNAIARYGQLVATDGTLLWGTSGKLLAGEEGAQRNPSAGKIFLFQHMVAWQEKRSGSWDVRGRVVTGGGPYGDSSISISAASGDQVAPQVLSTFSEAASVLWRDENPSPRAFAQRFNSMGSPLWSTGGVPVSAGGAPVEAYGQCTSGSSDGIVLWSENNNLRVQRYGNAETPLWTPGGVVVSATRTLDPAIVSDLAGGAIVCWTEVVPNGFGFPIQFNLRAQRVDANGSPLWSPGGVLVRSISPPSPYLKVAPDTSGGVFLVSNEGNRFLTSMILVVNHVTSAGVVDPAWPAGGRVLTPPASKKFLMGACADGDGSVIAVWEDARDEQSFKLYGQRVNDAGVVQWPAGGLQVAVASGAQWLMDMQPTSAGAIILFADARGASWDLYVQRLNSWGTRGLEEEGMPVCTAPGTQQSARLTPPRGYSDRLAAWQDGRDPAKDQIYVAGLSHDGYPLTSPDGFVPTLASLVSARIDRGTASIVWEVTPSRRVLVEQSESGAWVSVASLTADGTGRVTYVQPGLAAGVRHGWRLRLDRAGGPVAGEVWLEGTGLEPLEIVRLAPNPVADEFVASLALPSGGDATLEILDVGGRRIWSRTLAGLEPGRHDARVSGFPRLGPGLYFLRLRQGSLSETARFASLR